MNGISAIGLSGMAAAMQQASVSAQRIAAAAPEVDPSLLADTVGMVSATYAFKANLKVVQVGDEMMGTLLNAFA